MHDPKIDRYRAAVDALDAAPARLTPDLDPNYEPYGRPPNGYALALAAEAIKRDDEPAAIRAMRQLLPVSTPRRVATRTASDYHRQPPPDGYKIALAKKERRR